MNHELEQKYQNLQKIFTDMQSVIVAYSGGVDSALLLKVGTDQLQNKCVGVIAVSPSLSRYEYDQARRIADIIGARYVSLETEELKNPEYQQNDKDRCYYCKYELFSKLTSFARESNFKYIVDGNNTDDISDYRPGMKAAKHLKIRSPLIEADFNKSDIRNLAKRLQLPNWDKPAQPCLASRVAYGIIVREDILAKIDAAEKVVRDKGFKIVRVRYLGDKVSVEVGQEELGKLFKKEIQDILRVELKLIGFKNIYFDQTGYRSGRLNILQ